MKKLSDQTGVALLALMLFLILGVSYMLVAKLNANILKFSDSQDNFIVLNQAKQALIAYALTVPERSSAVTLPGPGYLPCPDTDNDGASNSPCGPGAIGRFPYKTLEEEEFLDGSGETLWYALSDDYRNIATPHTPLNSETQGELTVDGQGDVVAVIIAPGNSLSGQQRDVDANSISNYLEDDNQDGDTDFISSLPGDPDTTVDLFNDSVIPLTRQELMGIVEKRVLAEVSGALESFRNDFPVADRAYPWLVPFADPSTSTFVAQVNTWAGHLPVHIPGQDFTDNPATPFTASWSISTGGNYAPRAIGTPPLEACLRSSTCTGLYGNLTDPLSFDTNNVTCTWQDRNTFICSAVINYGASAGDTRTYTFSYTDPGANVTLVAPTASTNRTRTLSINGTLASAQVQMITVVDRDSFGNALGGASLSLNAGDTVAMNITGVDYQIDTAGVDLNDDGDSNDVNEPGELPTWFVNNNWHYQVYAAYPVVESPPGSGTACTSGVDCLTLSSNGTTTREDIRAIAVVAGQDLTFGDRPNNTGSPGVLTDYFDLDNSDGILDEFEQQAPVNSAFNDQVRVIRPYP